MWQLGKLIHGQLLIGGTALALQIGHRQSEDLDFVIPNPVPENIVELIKASSPANELEHLIRNKQQYYMC
ncbi:MAG: nucleotidyl transferase AbiEii/AbiGii toxin family protein [Patescibacteria group bacterium]|nr:nucleotidyl transferase AbiEii/AbiGii toxin family protein [Patescibacteria group bacterium]